MQDCRDSKMFQVLWILSLCERVYKFEKAHSIRSHGSVSVDADLEPKQKQSDDREKQLRAQQALQRERKDKERRFSEAIDANSPMQVLSKIQSELSQL